MKEHEENQDQQGAKAREYLIFELAGQEYGIDILKVQEIRGHDADRVAPIADMPAHVRGVMNLRGAIVPVVDLCAKLGIERAAHDERTVVVVVLGLDTCTVGIVVNGVSDVTELQPSQIKDPPRFGMDRPCGSSRASARSASGCWSWWISRRCWRTTDPWRRASRRGSGMGRNPCRTPTILTGKRISAQTHRAAG